MISQTLIPSASINELTLSNFIPGNNATLMAQIESVVTTAAEPTGSTGSQSTITYLWAERGAGKTHLLHGITNQATEQGVHCRLLSLASTNLEEEIRQSATEAALICIDNLEVIARDSEIELEILSLFEKLRVAGARLIIAARKPQKEIGIGLPDLVSRLSSGSTWRLHPLSDENKKLALQKRASLRGFTLNDQVVEYVMNRFSRDTVSLFAMLDQLDRASLAHQRRITVPFIREIIG